MDILDLGPQFKAAMGRLRAFAEARPNWYFPRIQPLAGDNPGYVVNSGTLRIVFTWSVIEHEGSTGVYRHLSVSTTRQSPGVQRFPSQVITYTVASLLGFTGAHMSGDMAVAPGDHWHIEFSSPDAAIPHVMLVEPVPENALTSSSISN